MENPENSIEWITGQRTITVSLSYPKLKNKVLKLAETHDEVKVIAVNDDGTILAKLPLKYLKLSPPRKVSEEQREKARERMLAMQQNK